jgi:hypothetical protein
MLSAADIHNLNSKRDRIRRVIKRGVATNATVGTLSSFMSHARRYSVAGNTDSIEVAILPHDNASEPFSRGGDSGSLIIDAHGRAVAMLTSGTGKTDSSDITFATLITWLWELIKAQFPGANFCFDDLEAFLSDVS